MMDFTPTRPRRSKGENIVPMINVVFLLLIFFLMSAQIAPPEPFDVNLPQSDADAAVERSGTLYVSATGALSFDDATDDAVFEVLSRRTDTSPLLIHADAQVSAARLAALLPRLAAVGVRETRLVTGVR